MKYLTQKNSNSQNQTTSNGEAQARKRINPEKTSRIDVYNKITNIIIEQLESGKIPWENPNIQGIRVQNLITGHRYTGVNTLILQMSDTPFFMTFKQAKNIKASIKKGAKSFPVVYWNITTKTVEDEETGEEEERTFFILKYYNVFKITDIENLPERLIAKAEKILVDNKTISSCDEILNNYPNSPAIKNFIPTWFNDSNGYSSSNDTVYIQPMNMFKSENHYYSTLFHEIVHSTGHTARLDRFVKDSFVFGSVPYAKEELTADLGAAFLMAEADQNINIENKAAYIQSWLKALNNDKKLIITAAGKAEKAVNHILNVKVEGQKQEAA